MKPISRLIFWCIIIGIGINMMKLFLAQNDAALIRQEGVYPWYFRINFYGNVLVSFASVGAFIVYRKFFPVYVTICYILMILFVFIASAETIEQTLKRPNFFYSLKGIGTFLNFGILFIAADTNYFPKILKLFYYCCFVIIISALVNLGKVGIGAGRGDYMLYIRDYTVFLIWVFPYFFLQHEPNKRKNILNIGAFLLIFIFVLSIGGRSYVVLYLLYIIAKFKMQLQTRNGMLGILGIIVLVAVGYFVLANSDLSGTLAGAFNNLSERTADDSRSDQLKDFMSQYDTDYLFQGVGPLKQWYWHSIGAYYDFLDNNFLLMAWWAGIPTIITYIFFLIKTMFTKSEILMFQDIKGTKLILGFWIGACLGFAIYVAVSSELYYYFISLMLGLTVCQYSKIIDPEPEPEPVYEDT